MIYWNILKLSIAMAKAAKKHKIITKEDGTDAAVIERTLKACKVRDDFGADTFRWFDELLGFMSQKQLRVTANRYEREYSNGALADVLKLIGKDYEKDYNDHLTLCDIADDIWSAAVPPNRPKQQVA